MKKVLISVLLIISAHISFCQSAIILPLSLRPLNAATILGGTFYCTNTTTGAMTYGLLPAQYITGLSTTSGANATFTGINLNIAGNGTTRPTFTGFNLVAGANLTLTGSFPNFTIAGPSQNTYTAGTGISIASNVITNSSPDQTVAISGSGIATVTGTYPSFNVNVANYGGGSYTDNQARFATDFSYTNLGTIINEPFTSSRSNFSANSNFSIVGSRLQVTATPSSTIVLSNLITHDLYGGTNLEDYTIICDVTVGTINTTTFGVAFGLESINSFSNQGYQVGVMLNTNNAGRINYYYDNNINVSVAGTSRLPSVTTGDVLRIKIQFVRDRLLSTLTNLSVSPNTSITETLPLSVAFPVGSFILPSYGKFAIYGMGGTHSISGFSVTSNEFKGSDYLLIGDSNGKGFYNNSIDNRFWSKISAMNNGRYTLYAAPGNRFQDNNINEITSVLGSNVIIVDIGTNNGSSETTTVFETNFRSLISSLTASGYTLGTKLFVANLMPRNTFNVNPYNNIIGTIVGTNALLDQYSTFVASTGTSFDPIYSQDGIHLNIVGHQKKADLLSNYFNFPKKSNYRPSTNYPVIDSRTGYLGIGRTNPLPNYNLEVGENTNESTAKFGTNGVYITTSPTFSYIGFGSSFDNGSFVARTARPILMGYNGVDLYFYQNAGQTIGNNYTPTLVGQIGATANGARFNNIGFGTVANCYSDAAGGHITFGGSAATGSFVANSTSAVTIGVGTLNTIQLYFNTGLTNGNSYTPTERHRFNSTGLSLGQATAPLAYLQVAANTASIPSMILTSSAGVNYTGTISGAIWNNSSDLQIQGVGLGLNTVGAGLKIKEGTNAAMGTATLVGGTVTVSTTKVTANSRIFLTVNGGTLTNVGSPYISARTAGTSFTITSTNASDASNVAWIIIEPN
jgi:hypothetical protein